MHVMIVGFVALFWCEICIIDEVKQAVKINFRDKLDDAKEQ